MTSDGLCAPDLSREQILADFDIVLPPATALHAAAAAAAIEAELLKAAHEVLVEAGVPMGGDGGAILQVGSPASQRL